MDISSLLSPSDTLRASPTPAAKGSAKKTRKPRSSTTSKLANTNTNTNTSIHHHPPNHSRPTLPHNAVLNAQRSAASPVTLSPTSGVRSSAASTPTTGAADGVRSFRQPSTPGMDTLADLASMQHHQQTARVNAGSLRSADVHDPQPSSSTSLPTLQKMTKSEARSRLRAGSFDVTMSDTPHQIPSPRTYFSNALSTSELEQVTQIGNRLLQNPFSYQDSVDFINLLHKGFRVYKDQHSSAAGPGHLRSYELLKDLTNARESMTSRFAMGEDLWAGWIEDQRLLATSLEDKLAIRELCEKAVSEEATSSKLWLLYGQWMQAEYEDLGRKEDLSGRTTNGQTQLSAEEEQTMAAEIFGWQQLLSIWQRGAQETMWRVNDSAETWDRYTELLLRDLPSSPQPEAVRKIEQWFTSRLQIPHASWDTTSQKFSTFVSAADNENWEAIMQQANRMGAEARQKYTSREFKELSLEAVRRTGDRNTELNTFNEYIDSELEMPRKKRAFDFNLANALFQRALLRFPANTELWERYIMFLNEEIAQHGRREISILPSLEKATRHCPWSGTLWAQYMLASEIANLPYPEIEDIKHRATKTDLLDLGDLNETAKVMTTWCGFLRRRAFTPQSNDEDMDVAEVGIRSAIEDLQTTGRRRFGKDYAGDPEYRLERIYIKYLTQARNYQGARDTFRKLCATKGHDSDFWLRYYVFEMITWSKLTYNEMDTNKGRQTRPIEATQVLQQALRRSDLDYPEKILRTYLHHCEDHEDAEQLQIANAQVWKQTKAIQRRREQETLDQWNKYQLEQQQYQLDQQQHQSPDGRPTHAVNGSAADDQDHLGKRKRDEETDQSSSKKTRPGDLEEEPQVQPQSLPADSVQKRDRENATIVVRNIPTTTTMTKVRQFFRDCGTINSLKLTSEKDGQSQIAFLEFETKEDVTTAQTKEGKDLDGNPVEIQVGSGEILYVCNFPPTTDEAWLRQKFEQFGQIIDIRFPSLKYNTHRRFAYIQFQFAGEAHAATALDGEKLEGGLELLAKISDPGHKQSRHGAMYEGREVYIANLPWNVDWKELKALFKQYGYVEHARIPRKLNGMAKGIGYVVFRDKPDVEKALALNKTTWKGRVLNVSVSTNDTAKRQAIDVGDSSRSQRTTASPAPHSQSPAAAGAGTDRPGPAARLDKMKEIQSRIVALLNIPDTINDARIRALAEPFGELVQVMLKPNHQGAVVEFKEQASAGKASLALEGREIVPGRQIKVGTVLEMRGMKEEMKVDRIGGGGGPPTKQKKQQSGGGGGGGDTSKKGNGGGGGVGPVTAVPGPALVRRPGAGGGGAGRRGGLGAKRGGGGGAGKTGERTTTTSREGRDETDAAKEPDAELPDAGPGKAKSNADFKAMMMMGK